MKLTKENVCVFIEDEQQLEQARELLVKYRESVVEKNELILFYNNKGYKYLRLFHKKWFLANEQWVSTKITLTQLEQILKDGSTKQD